MQKYRYIKTQLFIHKKLFREMKRLNWAFLMKLTKLLAKPGLILALTLLMTTV
jgi:hypothetical protein